MKFKLKESLSTIHYFLYPGGEDREEVEWEFEPSLWDEYEFRDAIMKQYSKETLEEILKEYLPSDYSTLTIEEQTKELKDLVLEYLDLFDEDAEDFFYDAALEQYYDAEDYRKDPYSYNGVSPRDFY